ncbi:MAG: prepilin-type N-terminal cleavage/methylation domain-containing protein [Patescibacteria group bacterium]|jgi:prepilin-type N-terminal cleavage/methylation domain-containing protein
MNAHFRQRADRRGFTLLEMMVYLLIVGVVLVSSTLFAYEFTITRVKSAAFQETERNARIALARITSEIRRADGYNLAGSVFGINPGQLSLIMPVASGRNPTVFAVAGGRLTIQQGAGPVLPLTSSKVNVTDLLIDDLSRPNKTKTFRIRLRAAYVTDLQYSTAATELETTAQIKKSDGYSN